MGGYMTGEGVSISLSTTYAWPQSLTISPASSSSLLPLPFVSAAALSFSSASCKMVKAGLWAGSLCQQECMTLYTSSGHPDGCSRRYPHVTFAQTFWLLQPLYGRSACVQISKSKMPKLQQSEAVEKR